MLNVCAHIHGTLRRKSDCEMFVKSHCLYVSAGCLNAAVYIAWMCLQVAQVLNARMYDCVCKFDKGKGGQSLQWAEVSGNASWINQSERGKQQQHKGKPSPWTQVVGKANWIRGNANINLCVDDE